MFLYYNLSTMKLFVLGIAAMLSFMNLECTKKESGGSNNPIEPPVTAPSDVEFWLTQPDKTVLFRKQSTSLVFTTSDGAIGNVITVDTTQTFQTIDGFGYTLTGGSASLINALPAATKDELLNELFRWDDTNIGVSYLRVSIGASDLSASTFTYNDLPAGQIDPTLQHFSIDQEKQDLIPVLKKILAINPAIKILGSPWSPPTWMKTNNSFVGGSLKPEYYSAYAQYFVKYIQAMKAEGITIDAITPQNEPLHPGNNPSMLMLATEQAEFIKNHLGPAFQAASLPTKIIVYDHNADRPDYPLPFLPILTQENMLTVPPFIFMEDPSMHFRRYITPILTSIFILQNNGRVVPVISVKT